MLKVAEAAKELGLRESTVRAWIRQRRIAFVKLGRSVRVTEAEVDRLIHEGTVRARTCGRHEKT